MGQRVNMISKLNISIKSVKIKKKLIILNPKPRDLTLNRFIDRILVCCNILKRFKVRGEKLIVLGNSWLFAKSI